jgi:hypothetical protein
VGISTFSGPLQVGNVDGAVGVAIVARRFNLTVNAVTNTDFTILMPARYHLLRGTNYNTETYTGGGQVHLSIGTTAGGGEIVLNHDVKAGGVHDLPFVIGFNPVAMSDTTLFVRMAQTTNPTNVGSSTLVLEYIPLLF